MSHLPPSRPFDGLQRVSVEAGLLACGSLTLITFPAEAPVAHDQVVAAYSREGAATDLKEQCRQLLTVFPITAKCGFSAWQPQRFDGCRILGKVQRELRRRRVL